MVCHGKDCRLLFNGIWEDQERGKSIRYHCELGVVIGGIIFVGGETILAVGEDLLELGDGGAAFVENLKFSYDSDHLLNSESDISRSLLIQSILEFRTILNSNLLVLSLKVHFALRGARLCFIAW